VSVLAFRGPKGISAIKAALLIKMSSPPRRAVVWATTALAESGVGHIQADAGRIAAVGRNGIGYHDGAFGVEVSQRDDR
jgi:hypothetical protein